jgi:hypothetical protein
MLREHELQYYYFGFYRALKRYRSASLLGWSIVFLAMISVPFGWNLGRTAVFIEVVLTLLTILAGLALVWHTISALEEYVRIPFAQSETRPDAALSPLLKEIQSLMKEVDDGGWQEAYAAIGTLKAMEEKYALPKLESRS